MQSMSESVICFDLDDTLYKEIDYVRSAYGEIAEYIGKPEMVSWMVQWFHEGKNVFVELNRYVGRMIPIDIYLSIYRNHYPTLSLSEDVKDTLNNLISTGAILGLITDGRSISQRNKIQALGLEKWFIESNIIISEEFGSDKSSERNFRFFMDRFPGGLFYYVGDNPAKDFYMPNELNWETVLLMDDGRNIHQQDFTINQEYLPKRRINTISELKIRSFDGYR